MLDSPTDEELAALIKPIWLKTTPTREAQAIRSRLGVEFDDPRWKDQWVSDFIPDYVWDLVDIAAQRGIEEGRRLVSPRKERVPFVIDGET